MDVHELLDLLPLLRFAIDTLCVLVRVVRRRRWRRRSVSGDQNGTAPVLAHGPGCSCTRCRGFEPGNETGVATRFGDGNELQLRHGAYVSPLRLSEHVGEIASWIRWAMGALYEPRFEGAVQAAALAGGRVERAEAALEDAADAQDLARLKQDFRGWWKHWTAALARLGLDPVAADQLGVSGAGERSMVVVLQERAQRGELPPAGGES